MAVPAFVPVLFLFAWHGAPAQPLPPVTSQVTPQVGPGGEATRFTLAPQAFRVTSSPREGWVLATVTPDGGDSLGQGRGYIGVHLATEGGSDSPGLIVEGTVPDSPGAKAGLTAGDVLVELDGVKLGDYDGLVQRLKELGGNRDAKLTIERKFKIEPKRNASEPESAPRIGVGLTEQDGRLQVSSTTPGMPAAQAGLQVGDTLVRVDGKEPESIEDLVEHLRETAAGQQVKIVIRRELPIHLGMTSEAGAVTAWTPEAEQPPAEAKAKELKAKKAKKAKTALGKELLLVSPQATSDQAELREALASLRQELRALRKELGQLREEMKALHPGGDR
jgi:C-terminal processing protease CtpA/Prc